MCHVKRVLSKETPVPGKHIPLPDSAAQDGSFSPKGRRCVYHPQRPSRLLRSMAVEAPTALPLLPQKQFIRNSRVLLYFQLEQALPSPWKWCRFLKRILETLVLTYPSCAEGSKGGKGRASREAAWKLRTASDRCPVLASSLNSAKSPDSLVSKPLLRVGRGITPF